MLQAFIQTAVAQFCPRLRNKMKLEYRSKAGEFIFAFADCEAKFWLALDFFRLPAFTFFIGWDNAISFWIAIGHWIYPFDFKVHHRADFD